MNLSACLYLTPKGEIELKTRSYKLGMKKRSLLILLDKPQILEAVLSKSVLPQEECLEEIQVLLREDFICLEGNRAASPAPSPSVPVTPTKAGLYLIEDIVLSEAKFLLIDFCVDHFGTQSQSFVSQIRASSNLNDMRRNLENVAQEVEKKHPKLQSTLMDLIREINNTA